VELAADIEQQACAIDVRLVVAGRAPVALRRKLVSELAVQVAEVEHLTGRIVRLAHREDEQHPEDTTGPQRIRERLDALDQALAELDKSQRPPAMPADAPSLDEAPRVELTPGEPPPPLPWQQPAPPRRTGGRATGSSFR
jgi:hypothetical protein